jgi:DNA end-binding protein Ku
MASRSVWKGFIRFSLVAVPVKAYTATVSGSGGITLNQLHRECNSRIQYKKSCPIHGEVKSDEIVSGYEFDAGKYVVVDPDELDKLRTPAEKAVTISAFVKPDAIDARFYTGRTNYLVPDGPVGQKPYALLQRVMAEENRYAFAQVVINGKDQIVVLRPVENLLAMSFLNFAQDLKNPAEFKDEVVSSELPAAELALAKTLTETLEVDDFDLSKYKDTYTEKLAALIEAKVQGKQIVAAPAEEGAPVVNLMEALQKSLAQAKKAALGTAAAAKPPKLVAPSTAAADGQAKKRKKSS